MTSAFILLMSLSFFYPLFNKNFCHCCFFYNEYHTILLGSGKYTAYERSIKDKKIVNFLTYKHVLIRLQWKNFHNLQINLKGNKLPWEKK